MQQITNRTIPVRSSLLLAVFLILGFLLAACSLASTAQPPAVSMSAEPGVTVTATPTSTPTRTQTPVPTRTPTLTFTPRPTYTRQPTRTPAMFNKTAPTAGPEAYRLRPWSEENYAEIVKKMADEDYNIQSISEQWYRDNFLEEWIAAYPDSTLWLDSPWEIAASDPVTLTLPGAAQKQDIFSYAVEYELNVRQTPLEELQNWLAAHDFTVEKWFFVPDLFGPGQGGTIFQIYYYDVLSDLYNIFAIQPTDQGFKLRPVTGWFGAKYNYPTPVIQPDANNNGYPELILDFSGGWSDWCMEYLEIYEWNGRAFQYLYRGEVYDKLRNQYGCEATWAFEPVNGTRVSQLVIHDIYDMSDNCLPYEILRRYRWDGSMSETAISAEPKNAVCLAYWGDFIIQKSTKHQEQTPGIRYLEQAVRVWDAEAEKVLGPAGRDYLNLVLGIWYDQGGQPGEALRRLEPLAQAPTSADFDLPSRLAAAYLEGRQHTRLVGACLQIQALWEKELVNMNMISPSDVEAFIKKNGFFKPSWLASRYIGEICDPSVLVGTNSLLGKFNSPDELSQALKASGVNVTAMQTVDANQDGRQDLVLQITINHGAYVEKQLWFMHNTTEGYYRSEIKSPWNTNEIAIAELTLQIFQPGKNTPPAMAIQSGGLFYVVQVSGITVNNLFDMSDVTSFNLRSTATGETFDVTYTRTQYWDNQTITTTETAIWEPLAMKFILPSSIKDEVTMDLSTAAKLLYQEKDYAAALAPLQNAAAQLAGKTSPEDIFYRSAFLYFLGYTYEKLGHPQEAVRAYYESWQAAPGSTFSLAASGKLALKP